MLVRGFASYLQEATTSLVLSGGMFHTEIYHVRMIKITLHARQGKYTKTFLHQG